jgi:hypothetical protein
LPCAHLGCLLLVKAHAHQILHIILEYYVNDSRNVVIIARHVITHAILLLLLLLITLSTVK